jgi:hypothetical protein
MSLFWSAVTFVGLFCALVIVGLVIGYLKETFETKQLTHWVYWASIITNAVEQQFEHSANSFKKEKAVSLLGKMGVPKDKADILIEQAVKAMNLFLGDPNKVE